MMCAKCNESKERNGQLYNRWRWLYAANRLPSGIFDGQDRRFGTESSSATEGTLVTYLVVVTSGIDAETKLPE